MIGGIQNIISNTTLYNMTQSTAAQVTTETCLKAVGRPGFILMDHNIDPETKRFSATKEFLYQMICLGIYLAAIIPVFKKGAFSIARMFTKSEPVLQAFKKPEDFVKYCKLEDADKAAKLEELNNLIKPKVKFTKDNINENLAKGIIEGSSILGSVTGLAIVAPIASHPLIHPILKTIGLEKPQPKQNIDQQA
ncbi:hypothetical protein HDR58_06930 [bacterium]|nr:hypothetical protein [bacterium]